MILATGLELEMPRAQEPCALHEVLRDGMGGAQSPAQLKESEAFRENFGLQIICSLAPGESAQRVAKDWVAQRTVREAASPAGADQRPQEWTIPPITVSEYQSDLGLKFNLWGRPFIRAAVLGLADIPIIDWPMHRWPARL